MKRLSSLILLLCALVLLVALVSAQLEAIQLPWHAIAGGERSDSDDGRFILDTAIGQVLTGNSKDTQRFELESGFLTGGRRSISDWEIYLPVLTR
jgi:hypothetical protein